MSASNSHLCIPLDLPFMEPSEKEIALGALQQWLEIVGHNIGLNDKSYDLVAFASADEAKSLLCQPDDQWKTDPLAKHQEGSTPLWLVIRSYADPTRPAMLIRETFQQPDFLHILMGRTDPDGEALHAFLSAPKRALTLNEFLGNLVLHEVKDNMAQSHLRHLPYSEGMDLEDRGDYLKDPFGVDPVEAMQGEMGMGELENAVIDANLDYIGSSEQDAIDEAIKEWTDKREDLQPVLDFLGISEDQAEEQLREWANDSVAYTGALYFELQGKCAIAAMPVLGKEAIYIQFDGITSSRFNAVLDDDYMAMLDLLRVDVRGWVDHLLRDADLPPAHWDIDLKAMVDELRPQMTPGIFGYSTGGAHATIEALAANIKAKLFELPPPEPNALEAWDTEFGEHFKMLCASIKDPVQPDAQFDEYIKLRDARNFLIEDAKHSQTPTQDYLIGLAMQVLMAQAADLDAQWDRDNGIIESELVPVFTSRENPNLERFPQLAQHPQYLEWIERCTSHFDSQVTCDYEWKNPPHKVDSQAALITHKRLASVLDNVSYSGNLVIAFEADLDDLEKISQGLQSEAGKFVNVHNAYLHIHDYNNGAGDGEPLSGTWTFHTNDVKNKTLRLDNDTCDSYGIQGVFGQFLADGSSVTLQDTPPVPKAREASLNAPTV